MAEECPVCQGSGMVEGDDVWVTCGACGGSGGIVDNPCRLCNGAGGHNEPTVDTCPACDGTGIR